MTYKIHFEKNPSHDDIQILYDGITQHAKQKKGMSPIEFYGYFLKDENGNIFGGCTGCIMHGALVVDTLWVANNFRSKGYGTQFMELAEKHAKENNCRFILVNTMDWEALEFYKNLSFDVEFERQGFDKDSVFYYLRKDLR